MEYKILSDELKKTDKSIIVYLLYSDVNEHPYISSPSILFIHFTESRKTIYFSINHSDGLYCYSLENIFSILKSIKNRIWVFDKKSLLQKVYIPNLLDINLYNFLLRGQILEEQKFETQAHRFIKNTNHTIKNLNTIIPVLKHKEMIDNMFYNAVETLPLEAELNSGFLKENNEIIETLADIEKNGIFVDKEITNHFNNISLPNNQILHSQYNIYTSTGRPSNRFDNINYAALNKESGVRKCFVSRYEKLGKMVLIDYSAFHPRIICQLVNFSLPIELNIYKYLGEMYFKRTELNEFDIEESKKLTFRQLYGGVESEFEHIKYFAKLKDFVNQNWKTFQENGEVLTPIFKRPITNKHLIDGNPNKLFNYILQATETEIAIPILNSVNGFLKTKKTMSVLYTYDSILFDFYKEDGYKTLKGIIDIMKINNNFPVKIYMGDSYDSMNQIFV